MNKIYFKKFLLAIVAMMAAMPSFAIDYWTVGKVQAVLLGGEASDAAGYVYVSSESIADASAIAGVTSAMQTDPVMLSGGGGTSAVNKEYFFYAKPNDGYKFVGFASTATGTPSGAGIAEGMAMVGDYYSYSAKSGAGYSSNTEQTAKVLTRYAVFEKINGGEGEDGGEGDGDGDDDTATETKVVSVTNQFGKNLVDAVLTINKGENFEDGDMVTHIYITFDHELNEITSMAAHKALAQAVTIENTTTKEKLEFNQYSCGVKSGDKHVLDMFLSSECYINNEDYAGVYVVTLPAGVVSSTNGLPNEAYTFTFTYGDGESHEEAVNLDDYLGNWQQVVDEDLSIDNPMAFTIEKSRNNYFVTNLYATTLRIPVETENGKYYLPNTQDDTYSFVSAEGNAVKVTFSEQNGKKQIFFNQFSILSDTFENPVLGGVCYFSYTSGSIPTAITDVKTQNDAQTVYDLQGRRLYAPGKGINIVHGKKYVVK